jgi:hypothetical protein
LFEQSTLRGLPMDPTQLEANAHEENDQQAHGNVKPTWWDYLRHSELSDKQ